MKGDVPDKIRVLTCLIAVVLAFSVNVSSAKAPEPPETERFSTVQGNSLASTMPIIAPKWHVLGSLGYWYDYYDLVSKYDWDADKMMEVMFCESSNNPRAYNPEWHKGCRGSYGLFQVSCVHSEYVNSLKDLYDPEINIETAYKIWQQQGGSAWIRCW